MKLIVSEEIYLSEHNEGDECALVENLKDKEISDMTLNIPYPYTEHNAAWWIKAKIQETQAQGRPVSFAIRRKDGYLIGGVGFDGLNIGKSYKRELGYWLAKPYWGRGIMTEVVKKVCDMAFIEFGLVKILATCLPTNIGSARVLEKCGFEQEGYLKKDVIKDGKYRDSKLFGLIRKDILE